MFLGGRLFKMVCHIDFQYSIRSCAIEAERRLLHERLDFESLSSRHPANRYIGKALPASQAAPSSPPRAALGSVPARQCWTRVGTPWRGFVFGRPLSDLDHLNENPDLEIAFSPDPLDAMHCVVWAWQGAGPRPFLGR